MPYVKNSEFAKDLNDEDIVWRYMDFAKFVDLLDKKEQYFVSGHKLKEIDPYEGHFQEIKYLNEDRLSDWEKTLFKKSDEMKRNEQPKFVFINCWHINNQTESDPMWKLYATQNRGIAIRTTVKKLKRSFHDHFQAVDITKVRYVDNRKKDTMNYGIIHRFSEKGISFEYENELRVFVLGIDNTVKYNVSDEEGTYFAPDIIPVNDRVPIKRDESGIYVKVDLSYFIHDIHVAPLSQKWFFDLVKTITKKYGLNDNIVKKSTLYDEPVFT
jgi:hypothetical protein